MASSLLRRAVHELQHSDALRSCCAVTQSNGCKTAQRPATLYAPKNSILPAERLELNNGQRSDALRSCSNLACRANGVHKATHS